MVRRPFEWIPLDTAGKVFPGQNIKEWANVFRLSVQLKQDIEPEILKEALKRTLDRIPSLKVQIRNGFFWHYYEINEAECPIKHDIKNFCYRAGFRENNGYLFRVYYHGCRISIDFYHALCDGYGGAVFISTLAGEYLRLKGNSISHNEFVLDIRDTMNKAEYEDAYERYAAKDKNTNLMDTFVYHKKGTKEPLYLCNYTTVIMSFEQLHVISKSYGVTVTELLAAILMDIHYRKQLVSSKRKKEVSVQIPVNLRKFFPSRTLRNFVLCVLVKIDPRKSEYTFEDIVSAVSRQLRQVNSEKAHHAYITRAVKSGTKAIGLVPLPLKLFFIKTGFTFGAEYSTTALLSNLGPITIPEDMKEHVEGFNFYTGPGLVNGARCGAVSCGDNLAFTFSNIYKESDIEKDFLKKLAELGISVTVETNRDTDFGDVEGIIVGDSDAYSKELFIPAARDRVKLKKHDISFKERKKRTFHL